VADWGGHIKRCCEKVKIPYLVFEKGKIAKDFESTPNRKYYHNSVTDKILIAN